MLMIRLTFLLALLLLTRCSKVDSIPDAFIGNWQMYGICEFRGTVIENGKTDYITNIPINDPCYYWDYGLDKFQIDGRIIDEYQSIRLEINEDGKFVFSNDFGSSETFKLKKIEQSSNNLKVNHIKSTPDSLDDGELYIAHLKAKNGLTFQFKLIYDEPSKRLVTVGWYKDLQYNTLHQPVVSGSFYNKELGNNSNLNIEFLSQFNKL